MSTTSAAWPSAIFPTTSWPSWATPSASTSASTAPAASPWRATAGCPRRASIASSAARLLAAGLDVLDIGMVHTPGLYFSVFHLEADGGVMITASHNPEEDNGFKIMRGKGTIFGARDPEAARAHRAPARRRQARGRAAGPGHRRGPADPVHRPHRRATSSSARAASRSWSTAATAWAARPRCPSCAGWGSRSSRSSASPTAASPTIIPIPRCPRTWPPWWRGCRPPAREIGIALDGDADRIGVVDPRGRIVWGDQLLMLFARDILRERPGATFVSEVKCSQVMYDDIAAHGGRAIMWKVGHSLIKTKMKEEKAVLAGEMSGHMFFADRYFGFDDAVYATARVVELLSRSAANPVGHHRRLACSPQHAGNPRRMSGRHQVRGGAAGARALRGQVPGHRRRRRARQFPDGWGLVRASNTGPVLVLRCEAGSPARLAEIRADIESTLATIKASLSPEG